MGKENILKNFINYLQHVLV